MEFLVLYSNLLMTTHLHVTKAFTCEIFQLQQVEQLTDEQKNGA